MIHIEKHVLVVANELRRVPKHQRDADLKSIAMLALVVAARSFPCRKGGRFESWAVVKVRGAIADELRRRDPLSRRSRRHVRRGTVPPEGEWKWKDYVRYAGGQCPLESIPERELVTAAEGQGPTGADRELRVAVRKYVSREEYSVCLRMFWQGMSVKAASEDLGKSKKMVRMILASALAKIREKERKIWGAK